MNNKVLATHCSYNPNEITSAGSDWTLYADGRVAAVTRSRWQGTRDDERWICESAVDVKSLGPEGSDNDAEAALISWADDAEAKYDFEDAGMRRVRAGHLVQ